ncbi:hypothetical protein Q9L58_005219 [Maublancomyces gigas]|uniref:Alpha/beta hydrolase fold-3 domain-containing protein n=1 Tax=Discina gigas TaxID=1032678 RepID=A0ABR3GJR8_9PEZI
MSDADLSISFWDKVNVIRGIFTILIVAGYSSITALFRGSDGAITWGREVLHRVARYQTGVLSLKQRRWLRPTTGVALEKYCQKQSIPLETVQLAYGAKIHWVGDRSAKKAILYFHGGGYISSLVKGHAVFMRQCVEKLAGYGENTVLAFVEYGLAPEIKYPTQYIQGTESLRYLIREGYKPSDIILGGDSAGGNLALAVISHILHPHPNIDRISLSEPLAGLLLLSPWVTFIVTAPSCRTNSNKDYLIPNNISGVANLFIDEIDYNEYSVPLSADSGWWRNLPAKQTLLVYGDHEVFRDDIREFSENMKEVENLTVVNCQREVHVACIFDAEFGLESMDMAKTVFAWLGKIFS